MPRYRLELEFDGGPFVGWQRQANGPSVQQAIEEAVHRMLGAEVTVHGAGRTDAGVHALCMTAHVEVARQIDPDRLRTGLNHHLRPAPIVILEATVATAGFHARFSATARHYLYRILNRRSPPALDAGRVWHVARGLDLDAMVEAARCLPGKHDFTSFRSSECQSASPLKTLTSLTLGREGAEILIEASAPSFLHHQVRNIVGTLKLVGEGARPVGFVAEALAARARAAAGPTSPAHGLYFVRADYPQVD